jgi:hypothetical protein
VRLEETMMPSWQNPDYARGQRRRRSLAALVVLLLIAAALATLLLRRGVTPPPASAAASEAARPGGHDMRPSVAVGPAPAPLATPPASVEARGADDDAPLATDSGAAADDFATRKALALSLYRQNELEAAQQQAQAALALQRDDELIELLMKLDRELRVQRNYDDARTANFTVLYDGYEHEETKRAVLDILKDAHAEIGKELDHFPGQPITVILYTSQDFTDVTRAPEWAGGMFGRLDGKIRVPVQGSAGQEQALRRVLFHEYTHALLYSLAPACPLWLHEGLAQYLSGERGVNIGQVIPLPALAGGFPGEARAALVAYMESLQAVSDLLAERGMPPMRRLLRGLGNGASLEAAFTAAYGVPFSRWAAAWRPLPRGESAGDDDR